MIFKYVTVIQITYYFSNKNHIFSSDKENSPGNIAILSSHMDSFYGILQQKIGCKKIQDFKWECCEFIHKFVSLHPHCPS